MSGETTMLVPKLRFPEFRGAVGWAPEPMGEVYSFKGNNSLSRDKLNYDAGSVKNIHYQAAEILPTITRQLTRCPDNRGTPPTRQTSQTCAELIPSPRAYSPCATSMISFPPITPCA